MPIYEYECSVCDKVFEVQQRISDDPLSECPDCGGSVKKLVSMSAFHLKGGGWYKDGYAGPSNGNGKNGGSSEKKESSAPACGKEGGGGCKNCPASAASA